MAVLEVVRIASKAGRGEEFGPRLLAGLGVQAADPECPGVVIHQSVERPDEWLLELTWTSVEAHHAWGEAHRPEWRAKVGWEIVDGGPMGLKHYTHVATLKGPVPLDAT